MALRYNSLKRLCRRLIEEIISTWIVAVNTKFYNFIVIFSAKRINYMVNKRQAPETPKETRILCQKHTIVLQYFEKKFRKFIEKYRFDENTIPKDNKYKNKIWVCWWQGLENAPVIIKRCIESIKENSGDYEVIVVDDSNYKEFVSIPSWMEEKSRKGIITRTHLSDYLRLSLLANHGGVWLDATFFCVRNCFDSIMKLPIWTIKRPGCDHLSVAGGMYANYAFACDYENRKIFGIIRDYLEEYWKTNNIMIDYLFLDYLIQLILNHEETVRLVFDSIPANNEKCAELCCLLNKSYNNQEWEMLCKDTSLFKLSWKLRYNSCANGEKTYYGELIGEEM